MEQTTNQLSLQEVLALSPAERFFRGKEVSVSESIQGITRIFKLNSAIDLAMEGIINSIGKETSEFDGLMRDELVAGVKRTFLKHRKIIDSLLEYHFNNIRNRPAGGVYRYSF